MRALLGRLIELAGIEIDLGELDGEADGYVEKVEAGLADRPDVAELVRAIEAEHPEMPSGDDLVSEIEKFLQSRPDGLTRRPRACRRTTGRGRDGLPLHRALDREPAMVSVRDRESAAGLPATRTPPSSMGAL